MGHHSADWLSFLCGLVFAGLGLAYLVAALLGAHLATFWTLPALLIALGAAGLAGTARAFQRRDSE